MPQIDRLAQEYAKQVKDLQKFHSDKGEAITDAINVEQLTKMQNEAIKLGETLENQDKINKLEDRLSEEPQAELAHLSVEPKDEYESHFTDLIRNGGNTSFIPSNVLQVGVDTDGGHLVPETWDKKMVALLTEHDPIRQEATVLQSSTTVNIAIQTGQANVDWVLENGAFPESNGTFSTANIGAHKYGGIVPVSHELLADSMINISELITSDFVDAFADKEQAAFIGGTGTNQPTGILTGIPATMQKSTAAAGTVAFDDLKKLTLAVKQQVANTGKYYMSRETLISMSILTDSNDNYLWTPSTTAGAPDMFFGKSLVILDSLPSVAANKLPVLFGSLKGYRIYDRTRAVIQVLKEAYAKNGQVGYLTYRRVDAKMIDTQRLAGLKVTA